LALLEIVTSRRRDKNRGKPGFAAKLGRFYAASEDAISLIFPEVVDEKLGSLEHVPVPGTLQLPTRLFRGNEAFAATIDLQIHFFFERWPCMALAVALKDNRELGLKASRT